MPCGTINMKRTGGYKQTVFTKNGKLVSMRGQRKPLKLSQLMSIRRKASKRKSNHKNLVWEIDELLK